MANSGSKRMITARNERIACLGLLSEPGLLEAAYLNCPLLVSELLLAKKYESDYLRLCLLYSVKHEDCHFAIRRHRGINDIIFELIAFAASASSLGILRTCLRRSVHRGQIEEACKIGITSSTSAASAGVVFDFARFHRIDRYIGIFAATQFVLRDNAYMLGIVLGRMKLPIVNLVPLTLTAASFGCASSLACLCLHTGTFDPKCFAISLARSDIVCINVLIGSVLAGLGSHRTVV